MFPLSEGKKRVIQEQDMVGSVSKVPGSSTFSFYMWLHGSSLNSGGGETGT